MAYKRKTEEQRLAEARGREALIREGFAAGRSPEQIGRLHHIAWNTLRDDCLLLAIDLDGWRAQRARLSGVNQTMGRSENDEETQVLFWARARDAGEAHLADLLREHPDPKATEHRIPPAQGAYQPIPRAEIAYRGPGLLCAEAAR